MIPPFKKARVKLSLKRCLKKTTMKASKVDSLVWLNYILFMKVLAAECETLARSEKSRTITAEHVKSAKKVVFRKLRG